jgi:hypothetical protein
MVLLGQPSLRPSGVSTRVATLSMTLSLAWASLLTSNSEDTGDAMPAKVRNALTLYSAALKVENVGIHQHDAVLYKSLYRFDDQLSVNQHIYRLPVAHSPVFTYICRKTRFLGASLAILCRISAI